MSEVRTPSQRSARTVAVIVVGAIGAVLLAIETVAVRGQLDFARHVLELEGHYVAVVPLALEGATAAAAGLTLWATLTGDPVFMHKLWTWIFLGAAVAANWSGALAAGRSTMAALFLAFTCVGALHLWHALLQRIQRNALRALGAMESPLPRFRVLRLIVAPRETFTAWKLAIRHDITRPADALALARREVIATPAAAPAAINEVDLTGMSKREAIEHAAHVLGTFETKPVRTWLAERGVTTDPSNARKVLVDLEDDRRRNLVRAIAVEA